MTRGKRNPTPTPNNAPVMRDAIKAQVLKYLESGGEFSAVQIATGIGRKEWQGSVNTIINDLRTDGIVQSRSPGKGEGRGLMHSFVHQAHKPPPKRKPAAKKIPAPDYNPDAVGFDPVKRAAALEDELEKQKSLNWQLLGVLTDIRIIVDPDGKIPVYKLAGQIEKLFSANKGKKNVIA
ncbi:MAG: hypothetical protein LBQ81_08255 [Zoogloeaceae bacterium]|jgi:hypothetical protein|nr:hypothetical protein [Zoogloeaceae bacterium]